MCLEAEVQVNKKNSDAWTLLGSLLSENDFEKLAIIAYKKGFKANKFKLDSLLELGLLSAKEFDQFDSI